MLIQNQVSQSSYVIKSADDYTNSRSNHFTQFSFSGAVNVQLKLPLLANINSVEIRPLSKGVIANISGNKINFTLNSVGQYGVIINNDQAHPLFIFANPLEVNPPAPSGDPNVYYLDPGSHGVIPTTASTIYFRPGIHDIGAVGSGGTFQDFPDNKTIYLAGGAYVRGVIRAQKRSYYNPFYNFTVKGRGVLSGINTPKTNGQQFLDVLLNAPFSILQVEGIVLTDARDAFGISSYIGGSKVNNVKVLSWIAGGFGSRVSGANSFTKTGDDHVEASGGNLSITNHVAWITTQGTVIQLGWNQSVNTTNVKVDGLDIIGDDTGTATGYTSEVGNVNTIGLQNINGITVTNINISNVNVDVPSHQVIGIHSTTNYPGSNQGIGTIDGIVFKNINVRKPFIVRNVFNGNGTQTGEIRNVTFDNVRFGGTLLTSANESTYIKRLGKTYNFIYTNTATDSASLTLAADPSSLVAGQSTTLSWSSRSATSCTASGAWTGSMPLTGSLKVSPTTTSQYVLTCSSATSSDMKSVTVQVNPTPTTRPNLALGKLTSSSSNQNADLTPNKVVDGNTETRWSSSFADNQWIRVDLGALYSISEVKLVWEAAYGKSYQIQISADGNTWATIYSTTTGDGGTDILTGLSGTGRFLRMLGLTRGTPYGFSLWELEVIGTPPPTPGGTNWALNRPSSSSSQQSSSLTSNFAFDGNQSTRWGSSFADNQWISVDLGSPRLITNVKLFWETAYGKAFKLQASTDGTNWVDFYSTTTGTGGVQDLTGLSGYGRYFRIFGQTRGTGWGFSLWEIQVFGQ